MSLKDNHDGAAHPAGPIGAPPRMRTAPIKKDAGGTGGPVACVPVRKRPCRRMAGVDRLEVDPDVDVEGCAELIVVPFSHHAGKLRVFAKREIKGVVLAHNEVRIYEHRTC